MCDAKHLMPFPINEEKNKKTRKSRRFQLTLNQPEVYEEVKKYLTERKQFKFLYSCKEIAPETGHRHIHIYVCFSNTVALSIKKIKGSHVEPCRGNHASNMEYIEKGGDIIEKIGEEPHQGQTVSFSDMQQIKDPSGLTFHEYCFWERVKHFDQSMTTDDVYKSDMQVYYIQGESGSGKSRYVFEELAKTKERFDMISYENGYWIGVSQNPAIRVAVYDEWRSSDMKPKELIKLIDYNVQVLNTKFGNVFNHYHTIYITSLLNVDNIYVSLPEESREQWKRRIKVINIEK